MAYNYNLEVAKLTSKAKLIYFEGESSSIQAFYGPYTSLADAIDYFNTVVTQLFRTVPKGYPIGIVENGTLVAEYIFTGLTGNSTTVTTDNFAKKFPSESTGLPADFIEVMEPGIYNIDANYTVEPSGSVVVGTNGSSSDLSSLALDVERIKAILGDLYSSEGDSHFEITQ